MCRVLAYLGPQLELADLMTKPKNSLVNQSFDARFHHLLQLGGSGFASWEEGSPNETRPLIYRSAKPTFYDKNLSAICENVRTNCLLAHIRATGYSDQASVNEDNCHPFLYPGFRLALAHNGGLPGWRDMLQDIAAASKPAIVRHLSGSTDTEPLYCLLMSQYEDPTADMDGEEILAGLTRFMKQVRDIKKRHGNTKIAKLKFFLADGNDLVVANMGLGENYASEIDGDWDELRQHEPGTREFTLAGVKEPVWYLAGDDYADFEGSYQMRAREGDGASTVIVASEPLTAEADAWKRVPFNHAVFIQRTDGGCRISTAPLEF
jgi:glutamine amidotransferase